MEFNDLSAENPEPTSPEEREEIVLSREGDYVRWVPGTDHTWKAEQDSVVLTVRWPSVPNGE